MNGEHPNTREALATERRALHTPGPWCVEDPFDQELVIVQAGKGTHEWQFIATIPHGNNVDADDIPDVIAERNARLIAAAPTLLAAAQTAHAALLGGGYVDKLVSGHPLEQAYCALVAAIAKAEGRS